MDEQPERPLDYGCWLCDCDGCRLALRVAAAHEPRPPIVLKTASSSPPSTRARWGRVGWLAPLCYVRRDDIREVFVGQWWPAMPSERWWSLSRVERTKHRHQGLKFATRSALLEIHDRPAEDNPWVPKGPLSAAVSPVIRSADDRGVDPGPPEPGW